MYHFFYASLFPHPLLVCSGHDDMMTCVMQKVSESGREVTCDAIQVRVYRRQDRLQRKEKREQKRNMRRMSRRKVLLPLFNSIKPYILAP